MLKIQIKYFTTEGQLLLRFLLTMSNELVGPEAYAISGALFKKKNTKLRIKIRYEREYLFRMRN